MPYPNEHACRLRDPDDFQDDSFVRVSRETDDGDPYDVIRGDLVSDGSTQDQSHRYPTDTWSEAGARRHCRENGGQRFEPAADNDEGARMRVNTDQVAAPRFFQSLADQVWAVQSPAVLRELAHIAQRGGSVEAVERWRSERADDARTVRVRNGVAIMPLMGPIFPRANLMTEVSGATSIGAMARDLQQMADRSDIRAIMLEIDSPGGAVTDVDQMADIIAEVARKKPVTAYVGGTAASAAYWLATAANEIIVARTGQVGGIGVVATVPKQMAPDDMGIQDFEIVSANAENKRPDPEAEDGRQSVRDRINPIEETFIATVAENRGVSTETVRADFGRGNVVVGNAAVRRRMADRIGTFEGVLQELQQVPFPQPGPAAGNAAAQQGVQQAGLESTGAAASAAFSQSQQEEVNMANGTDEAQAEAQTSANTTAQQPAAAGKPTAANPADVVDLCNQAQVPNLAASLIREGATYEQAQARVQSVGTMQERCDAAVQHGFVSRDKADELRAAAVKAGKSPDQLSTDLFNAAVENQSADDAVRSQIGPDTRMAPAADQVWENKFKQVAG